MTDLEQRLVKAFETKCTTTPIAKNALNKEARRLFDLIQAEIAAYYKSYTPLVYRRTGKFYDSLRIRAHGDVFEIYFEPNLAYRESGFPNGKKVFIPTLLNQGWFFSDHAYHFSYYEGYTFIDNAIHRFNQTTTLPIRITIESKYYPEIYGSL